MCRVTAALCLLLCASAIYAQRYVKRSTASGKVIGIVENNIEKYLGIPYAAPPVGRLRWKRPQPHCGWEDRDEIRNATYFRSFCPQVSNAGVVVGDEDCLFLNIYVPRKPIVGSYSVMVWIHDGAFLFGLSNIFDGRVLAGNNDVIVVTLNYRLGILGFLNTGDGLATGNYGLLDQRAALQWVRDNIGNFGGNKHSVTIFGNSAGSASVLYQAISPMNARNPKLFQRVIAQSGVPFSWWAFQSHPRHYALELFESAGCPTDCTLKAMSCLRKVSPAQLVPLQRRLSRWGEIWTPAIDGRFLTDIPDIMVSTDMLKARLNGRYDYIIGVNEYDINIYTNDFTEIQDGESFKTYVGNLIKIYFSDSEKMAQVIFDNYVDPTRPPTSSAEWQRLALKVNRDYLVLSQAVNMSRIVSSENGFDSTAYLYFFVQKPDDVAIQARIAVTRDDLIDGAVHGDDLGHVFGAPLILPGSSDENQRLSSQMMAYWTNFAKTGNPSTGREVPTMWPHFNWETQKYMVFGKDTPADNLTHVEDHLETDKVIFWTEQLEQFGEGKGLDDSVAFSSSFRNDELPGNPDDCRPL